MSQGILIPELEQLIRTDPVELPLEVHLVRQKFVEVGAFTEYCLLEQGWSEHFRPDPEARDLCFANFIRNLFEDFERKHVAYELDQDRLKAHELDEEATKAAKRLLDELRHITTGSNWRKWWMRRHLKQYLKHGYQKAATKDKLFNRISNAFWSIERRLPPTHAR